MDNMINCPSTSPGDPGCSTTYAEGTGMMLTAAPAAGSYFAGSSADAAARAGRRFSLVLPGDATCTAEFDDGGGAQAGGTLSVTTSAEAVSGGLISPTCYVNFCTLRDALANGSGRDDRFRGPRDHRALWLQASTPGSPSPMTVAQQQDGVTIDASSMSSGAAFRQSSTSRSRTSPSRTTRRGSSVSETSGTLTLRRVTVTNNTKTGRRLRAGPQIRAAGTLTVSDSTISQRDAQGSLAGIDVRRHGDDHEHRDQQESRDHDQQQAVRVARRGQRP